MKKSLGLALVFTLALALPALAEEAKGTVQKLDRKDQSIVLDDGTQLWVVTGAPLNEVRVGDQVNVTYEQKGDKKVIRDLQRPEPEVN